VSIGGFAAVGLRFDLEPLTLETRFRWGRAASENSTVAMTQDLFGADLGIYKVFDLPRVPLGIGIGIRMGGDQVIQRFDTAGSAPDRSQWLWRVAPLVRFEAAVHSMVSLTLDAGADFHLGDFYDTAARTSAFGPRVVPFGALGLVVYFP